MNHHDNKGSGQVATQQEFKDAMKRIMQIVQPVDNATEIPASSKDALRLIDAANMIINRLVSQSVCNRVTGDMELQTIQMGLASVREQLSLYISDRFFATSEIDE